MTIGGFVQSAIGGIASAVMGSALGRSVRLLEQPPGVSNAAGTLGLSENSKNNNGVRTYVDFDSIAKLICYYYDCYIDGISEVGKPLYEYVTINTIPGFIKCQNASINIEGHFEESVEINSYLNGGFFYE